jgi:hypothetical protein
MEALTEEERKQYFEQIRNLCKANGIAIDKIAKQFHIKHQLVAQLFIETFQLILKEMETDG